jgi:hypothetical protein
MRDLTEAALVAKAKARGWVLKQVDGIGGYSLFPNRDVFPNCDDSPWVFSGRDQSTLRGIDEELDEIPTLKQLEAFEAAAATAAPGSESVQ